MADMTQAQARQAAITAGASPEDVDKFIANEGAGKPGGSARVSAQRITSAFDVKGSVGTNDLSAFHAQKATSAGADASAKGTYLSGATSGGTSAPRPQPPSTPPPTPLPLPPSTPPPSSDPGGGGGGPVVPGNTAPMAGLAAAAPMMEAPPEAGPGMMSAGAATGLRPLGRRTPPMESAALAGLQRLY